MRWRSRREERVLRMRFGIIPTTLWKKIDRQFSVMRERDPPDRGESAAEAEASVKVTEAAELPR